MANLLAIVSYKVFPAHMGGQKGIVQFYKYLQSFHPVCMAVSFDNACNDNRFSVQKILFPHAKMGLNFLQIFRLQKLVRKHQIDVVVAEHSYTGWLALLLKKLTGKPFLIHSHNIEASRFQLMGKKNWKLYCRYEGWIHRKADFSFFKTEEEMDFALQKFGLNASKCCVIPYGVETFEKISHARERLKKLYGISSTHFFYFNGTLDYAPNEEAVEVLISTIDPILQQTGLDYTILISGKKLRPDLQEKIARSRTMRYLEFVEDVNLLYQAASLFINPVVNNSGVKTKVVEALANHCTVISSKAGATGIPLALCGSKLRTVKDGDWKTFVDEMVQALAEPFTETPPGFFAYFSWTNIAEKAAKKIDYTLSHG